jgi:hypothetical protein
MPLWLRKFTFHKLKEHYDAQSGENDGSKYLVNEGVNLQKGQTIEPPPAVQKAAANYTVKAPKPKK